MASIQSQLLVGCALVAGLIVSQSLAQAGGGAAPLTHGPAAVELAEESFAARIERALGIEDTGADILRPLEVAIQKLDAPPSELADSIDELTHALLKGPHPSALVEKLLPLMEIGGAIDDPSQNLAWKWGTFDKRDRLQAHMGSLAFSLKKDDPKRASDIGRAALLLAALQDFNIHWDGLRAVEKPQNEMENLLGIPEGAFQDIVKAVETRTAEEKARRPGRFAALYLADKIAESKDPIKLDDVKAVLSKFDEAFRKGPHQLGYQCETLTETWQFINTLREKNALEGIVASQEQLEIWRKDFPDPNIDRWISQALKRVRPAGKFTRTEVVGDDGKISELKPDGGK